MHRSSTVDSYFFYSYCTTHYTTTHQHLHLLPTTYYYTDYTVAPYYPYRSPAYQQRP